MNNAKRQPIIAGDILAERYSTPVEQRIMIIEDLKTEELFWRYQLEDYSVKNPINTLEGEKYITLYNFYKS